jgi:hypothetical protein
MVQVLLLPILLVLMLMMAALLVSVDAYHIGRSLVSVKRRGDVEARKTPVG